jgi:hypothetical protein
MQNTLTEIETGMSASADMAQRTVAQNTVAQIDDGLRRLRTWLEDSAYAGIEPHDALTSPLLSRKLFGRSRFMRLAALQGLRRLPVNLRPLVAVRPRVNAISLGWALKAYSVIDDADARLWIDRLIGMLKQSIAPGYSGACWGYYFDWQTRTDFKPANLPIIVSTAFIGDGLLDVYQKYGNPECLQLARSACDFILKDLNRMEHPEGICFSYSPTDHEQVYNASILGAALLARVGAVTGERELIDTARQAIDFVVAHQSADGSWGYALGDHRSFIDNFHTGYVIGALRDYIRASGDDRYMGALDRGWRFYREHFLHDGCIPKYYHNRLYPIDAHAAAQSIVTLLDFGDRDAAFRVAEWTLANMQNRRGYFIYQIHRRFVNRIPYLRWSNAWMLYALARLKKEAVGG